MQTKMNFQDYIEQVYPGQTLSIQQMAAVGRWLRKHGFNVTKEYQAKIGKQVTVIAYDHRKRLPTACPIKVKPACKIRESIGLKPRMPLTFTETVNYIKDLHTVIEILVDELEKWPVQVPAPSKKIANLLDKLGIKHPLDELDKSDIPADVGQDALRPVGSGGDD